MTTLIIETKKRVQELLRYYPESCTEAQIILARLLLAEKITKEQHEFVLNKWSSRRVMKQAEKIEYLLWD